MGKFLCPKCKAWRHIEDADDPRDDHCWQCGTKVPYTDAELADMAEQMAQWTEEPHA